MYITACYRAFKTVVIYSEKINRMKKNNLINLITFKLSGSNKFFPDIQNYYLLVVTIKFVFLSVLRIYDEHGRFS